jgi:ADP-glucose pyrophosphorylase
MYKNHYACIITISHMYHLIIDSADHIYRLHFRNVIIYFHQ